MTDKRKDNKTAGLVLVKAPCCVSIDVLVVGSYKKANPVMLVC